MEKILKQLTEEFKILNKDCFVSLLSLLLFILKNSKGKINIKFLNKKISNYPELINIKCRYYKLGFIVGDKRDINVLNNNITLYFLLKNINKAVKKDMKVGKLIGPRPVLNTTSENKQKDWFLINLKSEDIYHLISVILSEYNLLLEKLDVLAEKSAELQLSKFNSVTNIVKGYSYDYSIKDFYITENDNEIIKVEVVSEYARDTTSYNYFNIEFEKLHNIYRTSNSYNFREMLKLHSLKGE